MFGEGVAPVRRCHGDKLIWVGQVSVSFGLDGQVTLGCELAQRQHSHLDELVGAHRRNQSPPT